MELETCRKQQNTPLLDAITKFQEKEPAYFRIPAHRFERGINSRFTEAVGEKIFRYDLSEAEGLDDLHHATGPIKEAEQLAADLWKARKSFFLVNGTTCGNEAMMLSAVKPGEKVMVMRNMHKSILMGLILSGAVPCFINPEYAPDWKLWCSVRPETIEKGFQAHPDCKAVFLVSPNYYGITSNLQAIAEICHKHDAILAIDEAHGSHLYFSDKLPAGALQQNVDMCSQSIHKTAGSMTQSSILHVGSDRIDTSWTAGNLQLVQSTSPSYILMASLDAARQELAQHGSAMMEKAINLSCYMRQKLLEIPGIQVLKRPDSKKEDNKIKRSHTEHIIEEIVTESQDDNQTIYDIDTTRVVFSAREYGISGFQLQELLYETGGVSTELADEENVVCVVTFANTKNDVDRLIQTLCRLVNSRELLQKHKEKLDLEGAQNTRKTKSVRIPEMVLTPREAYFHKKQTILWKDAAGKIAGEMIVPYPPGIPLIYPGERITDEIKLEIDRYLQNGCSLHGPKDDKLNKYQIIQ